jgi:3-deoxy-D-manno-octulosonic-acid transferase
MKVFDCFYTVLALVLFVLALPFIIILSFKQKYRHSIPSRFFLWNNPPFGENDIWFHVCSLGEAKAIAPIVERLGHLKIAISVTTHTGYEAALQYGAQVRYLPFEPWLWFWIKAPKKVVILEAEFWYLLFLIAKLRGARVIALNARISDRSFPKYYKMRWFYQRLLERCDVIVCQSDEDRGRFIALGGHNVHVAGNIKLAQKIEATKAYLKPQGLTIVAGSTHEGEEEGIILGFIKYLQTMPTAKLIIVPRHPQRFDKVAHLVQKVAPTLSFSRWSQTRSLEANIVLIDAMGELNNMYAIGDVAILGGAFAPIGGHNPLEPAHFGCKIISGKNMFLQRELFKYISHVQFVELDKIADALHNAQTLPPSSVNATIDLDRVIEYLREV